jgi:hypothetical protein
MLGIWLKFAENFARSTKDFVHHENPSHVSHPLSGGGNVA